jgi:hypothetical protein
MALNGTQTALLDGYLRYTLGDFLELEAKQALLALQAILADEITPDHREQLPEDVLDDIMGLRQILAHPCPQNRCIGDSSVGQEPGMAVWRISDAAHTAENIRREPLGVLGLTPKNDGTTAPVTKEDVTTYIRQAIGAEIAKLREAHPSLAAVASDAASSLSEAEAEERADAASLSGIGLEEEELGTDLPSFMQFNPLTGMDPLCEQDEWESLAPKLQAFLCENELIIGLIQDSALSLKELQTLSDSSLAKLASIASAASTELTGGRTLLVREIPSLATASKEPGTAAPGPLDAAAANPLAQCRERASMATSSDGRGV